MTHVKTPHPHAEMMKAYADDTSLCVFVKKEYEDTGEWWLLSRDIKFNKHQDFFVCLPKHKDAVLNLLNGGESEARNISYNCWLDVAVASKSFSNVAIQWSSDLWYMLDKFESRIKPRKEKLWIAVKTDKHETLGGSCRKVRICSHAFVNKYDAEEYLDLSDSQLIEIEVEV